MADQFNPNATNVSGLEWFASAQARPPLSANTAFGALIPSTTTETITELIAYIDPLVAGTSGPAVQVCADIYDATQPLTALDEQRVLTSGAANGLISPSTALFTEATGSIASHTTAPWDSTAWTFANTIVGENTPPPDSATSVTFIQYLSLATGAPAYVTFPAATTCVDVADGTTTVSTTGKRITRMSVAGIVANLARTSCTFRAILRLGGTLYYSAPKTLGGNSSWRRLVFDFDFTPNKGRQWCNHDLVHLQTGGGQLGLEISAAAGAAAGIMSLMLQPTIQTETRLATAYGLAATGLSTGWTPFPTLAVDDHSSASWAKSNTGTYTVLFSTGLYGGQAVLPNPYSTAPENTGNQAFPSNGWFGQQVATVRAVPTVATATKGPGAPAIFMRTASAVGVDAQPYVAPLSVVCDVNTPLEQQISNPGAHTYNVVQFLALLNPDGRGGVTQNGPLTAELHKRSDDSLLCGPVTIDTTDVPADGQWHRVAAEWAVGATLTANEGVYVKLQSTATVGWHIGGLTTYQPGDNAAFPTNADAASRSFGGTGDHGLINGIGNGNLDFTVTIAVPPAPPGTLAISERSTPNTLATTGNAQAGPISVTHLTWAATSLGGQFAFYEIQRLDDDPLLPGPTWADLIFIVDETKHAWDDIEPRRTVDKGIASHYRIRVVNTLGIASTWATFAAISISANPCCIYLTSNLAPTMPVAFFDETPYPFSWPEMSDVKLDKFLGRDFRVQFKPTERLGDAFTRRIIVALNDHAIADTGAATYRPGRPAFEPILEAVRAVTPYIAWSDSHGNRWFASVVLTAGEETESMGLYTLDATIEQISALPSPFETATPWTAP